MFGMAVSAPILLSYTTDPTTIAIGFAVAYLGSLFPDFDEPNSYLSSRPPWFIVSHLISFFTKHRGATHTIFFDISISIILVIGLYSFNLFDRFWILVPVFFVAYLSHLIGDSMTKSGTQMLRPFSKKKVYFLPKPFRFRTGSFTENIYLIFFSAIFVAELFYFLGGLSGIRISPPL